MLALYNRLNAILVRIRAFHQQKITLLEDVGTREAGAPQQKLLDMIDSQIRKVTAKAKAIQNGLYCLLSAVLAFLMCSLLTPAVLLHNSIGIAALAMHVTGLLLFAAGIGWAIRELTLSLIPLEEENAYLGVFTTQRQTPFDTPRSRAAKSA
jgi:hypothetical protein